MLTAGPTVAVGAAPAALAEMGDSVGLGVAWVGRDLSLGWVNRTFAVLNRRSRETHAGRALREAVPQFTGYVEEVCRRVLGTSEAERDLQVRGPQGQHWLASLFPADGGDGVLCVVRDNTDNKRLEQALQQSQNELDSELRFRGLIGEMFGQFANLAGDSVGQEIGRALSAIRAYAGAEQGSLLEFGDDGEQVRVTQTLPAERSQWLPEQLGEALPWYAGQIRKGRVVRLSRLLDLPAEAVGERATASAAGVKSHLCVPLHVRGATIGAIALTCFETERAWPDDLLERLRVIGQIIGSLLTLNSLEMKLRGSVGELTQLRDRLQAQSDRLREEIRVIHPRDQIVGQSDAMRCVLDKVRQVAGTDSTVLVLGETGTGKELIARAIHGGSACKGRPMVKVNCAALPSALVESELFGREKGAYTGALSKQIGRFELAHGSTIFLDEIGDLPLELQGKLLRVLQEGEFERLGSPNTVKVRVRVIAATNRDLAKAVRQGTFREDLYYRLNVFTIAAPPLREHADDIPLLVWTFVRQFGESMGKGIDAIPPATMKLLQRYPWPGNVRQLRNVVEHAMIISPGRELKVELPPVDGEIAEGADGATMTLDEVERRHVLDVLAKTKWRVSGAGGAAEILGMRPTTLESRMRKMGIRRKD